jgi:HTH-type transcriptional regulator/antitoxin HigA
VSRTPISPVRNERDYRAAVKEIEMLWNAKPGTPEHDRLEILGTLVDAYETKRWPIDAPDPVEAIKFRMEQGGLTQADLAKVLGSRSRASEILKRKRPLTIGMVWSLSRAWKIPAESLVKPYRMQERRRA